MRRAPDGPHHSTGAGVGPRRGKQRLRLLITAGPTREPIDAVRFISNYSTGYLGSRLAAEAIRRGHRVTVLSGPVSEALPSNVKRVDIETAAELEHAARRHAPSADAIIMAAAVADFRPTRRILRKLRRRHALALQLRPTPDIIGRLPRRPGQLRVGFAVESGRVLARATDKLRAKRLDLLVAQQLAGGGSTGSPFGRVDVQGWLLERPPRADGRPHVTPLGRIGKPQLARALLDKIEALCYGQPGQIA